MSKFKTPIWNGEFGPVYANPLLDANHERISQARYNVLSEQLRIYNKYKIHWSIWLYKGIGLQGMVHANPDNKWMKTIASFLERKCVLQLDAWGRRPSRQVEEVLNPLVKWIDEVAPTSKTQYPTPWNTERQITCSINQLWLNTCLQEKFAAMFKDMGIDELEECAVSFHFDQCVQREGLNKVLEKHAAVEESVIPVNRTWKIG